ncbi:ABC transporter permease [Halegenticoccus tardaugens]|uniref:ABC transporter permease n=1 Tax=Halegenticoccus tardaugens TaxID=2071624 RepID=UPI00100B6086|nr:ABC transporter permease [Halegenticoccus tardaugens]
MASQQSDGDRVAEELPFRTTADAEITGREQLLHTVDSLIIAPFRILWADWRARVGFLIIVLYVLMGTIGVLVNPVPTSGMGERYLQPFHDNWLTFETVTILGVGLPIDPVIYLPLGTDAMSQGLWSQIVHATPAMLKMILAGAVFSTVVATILGTLAGYKGGFTDRSIMTMADITMTIPGLPLVIIIAAVLRPDNPYIIGLILGINNWAGLCRAVRSQVLSVRERNFVEASRAMGLSTPRILVDDIIPDLMSYVSIHFVGAARGIIFESVALYYLGILPFTTFNWGVMMNLAYTTSGALYTWESAHWIFLPMITITILSVGLILFSQGLDRIFNPRVRARHVKAASGGDDDEEQTSPMATVPTN